jgi:hypothetical protein
VQPVFTDLSEEVTGKKKPHVFTRGMDVINTSSIL